MLKVVLYQPEIPPNTGNIMRLCAAAGTTLHLIEPLGFHLTDKHLKRAGLDYVLKTPLKLYPNFEEYLLNEPDLRRIFLCSTKGKEAYHKVLFQPGDSLVFGPETRGLPNDLLSNFPDSQKIRIPMQSDARSLNLSNAVAIVVYEALRQLAFE